MLRIQNQNRDYQQQINITVQQVNQLDIELAKSETRKEDLNKEITRELKTDKIDDVKRWDKGCKQREETGVKIDSLKHQLALIGTIDQETITEHQTTKERFTFLSTQSKDMRSTIEKLEIVIDELDNTIKKQFNKSFKAIAENFSKYFSVIFDGGSAKLALITEEQATAEKQIPVEEEPIPLGKRKKTQKIISGIEIEATPPNKKVHNVHALSGGEKSMTAIALICAIIAANTPPFVVLDEVEAALDESNSEKFGAIIKKLSKKTQFITITHNRSTMHYADILYGVTMGLDGSSNILSVKLEEAKKMMVDKEKQNV
jgi:chromosome segregation protein